jgi:hypothetical protein
MIMNIEGAWWLSKYGTVKYERSLKKKEKTSRGLVWFKKLALIIHVLYSGQIHSPWLGG